MRKMDKMMQSVPREILGKLFDRDNTKSVKLVRSINGKQTTFSVAYQSEPGYPPKVIDVSDGKGSMIGYSWAEALERARYLSSLRPVA